MPSKYTKITECFVLQSGDNFETDTHPADSPEELLMLKKLKTKYELKSEDMRVVRVRIDVVNASFQ